jgi:predicted Zn finger-like uncharacterized protein
MVELSVAVGNRNDCPVRVGLDSRSRAGPVQVPHPPSIRRDVDKQRVVGEHDGGDRANSDSLLTKESLMKMTFACPDCGATGSADSSLAGRQVRCKPCGTRFVVPGIAERESDDYSLEPPSRQNAEGEPPRHEPEALFVPSRGEEPTFTPRKEKRTKSRSTSKKSRREAPAFDWRTWLIRGGIAAVIALVAVALFAPRGMVIVGCILVTLGMVMVLVGFSAGAYGAFCEDFLYLILYLFIPLYTAYYLVTRWEDLWRWCVCSTCGVGLVLIGTEILRRSGVAD